jgi:hypothetical protein
MRWATFAAAGAVGVSLGLAASAVRADSSLLKMLPQESNAAMAVDVQGLLNSPLGIEQKWQSKLISNYAERPLAVPANARHVVVGSVVSAGTLNPIFEVALIDLGVPANLEKIARAQNGWVEDLAGRPAARTDNDVYYVQINDAVVAAISPAQRQLASRLVEAPRQAGGLNDFLSGAIGQFGDNEVVIALDLTNAFSAPQVARAIAFGGLPSLDNYDGDLARLGPALASIRGVKIAMNVEKDITATATVDFANAPSVPQASLKPFCLDVLREAGLHHPQLDEWSFKQDGSRIVATGPMDVTLFANVLSVFSPSTGAESVGPAATADANAGATPPPTEAAKSPAEASPSYYRAVAAMLDSAHKTASPTQSASWLTAQARRIQQLPTLNVDPELLAWGNDVSEAFTKAAAVLSTGQTKAMSAAQSIGSPTASASYSQSGYSSADSAESRAAFRNAQMQRRAAAQSAKAEASQQAVAVISDVIGTRGEIRAKMTQKYQVEF